MMIEATYEENYHSSPTDRFVMSRVGCTLRKEYFPLNAGETEKEAYLRLLEQCKRNVRAAIEKATEVANMEKEF
jgi:hypothetical protein